MSDNKYSALPSRVDKIFHLDWFEASIWTTFSGVQYFLEEINKNLFSCFGFKCIPSYGNKRFLDSLRCDDLGFSVFHNPRNGVKNSPIEVCFSGKFFRFARHQEFIDTLISFLQAKHEVCIDGFDIEIFYLWRPSRIDASADFISFKDVYIPYPSMIKLPGPDREFVVTTRGDKLDKITSGEDGARLTVYNKLTDRHDTEYLSRHPEFDDCESVWRVEFQFRRSEIKKLFSKKKWAFLSYESIWLELMGQCFARYTFEGFKMEPSLTSSYMPRKKMDDFGKLQYHIDRWLSEGRKVQQIEKVCYPGLNRRPEHTISQDERIQQVEFDFYEMTGEKF